MKRTLTQSPSQKLQQNLKLSPQLQQAVRLLSLSSQELEIEIQNLLEANPCLEIDHSEDMEQTLHFELKTTDQHPMSSGISGNSSPLEDFPQHSHQSDSSQNSQQVLEQQADETTLRQHLLWQVHLASFTQKELLIAHILIDFITEDGYLGCQLEEVQDTLKTQEPFEASELTMAHIEKVLHKIQEFEPAGVAARNLSECLSLQLNALPKETPLVKEAKELVNEQLSVLGSKNYSILCKKLDISQKKLKDVIHLITGLDPKPGRQISLIKKTDYIIPDLYLIRKKNGDFGVELNMNNNTKLRLSSNGSPSHPSQDPQDEHSQTFYRQQRQEFKEAEWFLNSLKNRYNTLLTVVRCLVQEQSAFLEQGEEYMQALTLEKIAELTNLHESTISRITTQKYISTHRGIFELKDFFSNSVSVHLLEKTSGETQSSSSKTQSGTSIRAIIKKLIQTESKEDPLSDEQIKNRLSEQHIHVTRRTVTKYRETLKIPASRRRYCKKLEQE